MNLEQLLERAGELPLVEDFSYFDVYKLEEGISVGQLNRFSLRVTELEKMSREEIAIFASQCLIYGEDGYTAGGEQVVFYIDTTPPEQFPIPPILPSINLTYLISAYHLSTPKEDGETVREEASYVIKGSFVEDKFVVNEAVEAVYEKPIKIADLPFEQANMLMNFLRGSNLFPQNEREELIAAGILASRFSHLILEGSPLEKHLEEMRAYAKLLYV